MNEGDAGLWTRIGSVDDFSVDQVHGIELGQYNMAIYRLESGEFFATDNICTHALALLSEGWLDGEVIECPLHGGCFSVRTGKGLSAPITEDLRTYRVKVADGQVLIELPTARDPMFTSG